MNRTFLLGAVVAALLALVIFLRSDANPAGDTSSSTVRAEFAVENTDRIQRVFIAKRNGDQVDLRRSEDSWIIDGKLPASDIAVKNLLDAISRVDIRTIPNYTATPSLVKNISTNGILVRIFGAGDQLIKSYYVGGSNPNETGTYIILENDEQPYVAHIPGWEGNLRFRYNLKPDEWRNKWYLQYEPEEIQSVSVEYPTERARSFKLERQEEEGFVLRPFYSNVNLPPRPMTEGVAEQYLVRLPKLYLNSYRNDQAEERAEFTQRLPFVSITVTPIEGEPETVKLYPNFRERTISQDIKTGEIIDDASLLSYLALLNDDKDWGVFATKNVNALLLGYDSF
ncbi:MAG: DUF4340 domain-containing protein [Bacteroidota bacterium]